MSLEILTTVWGDKHIDLFKETCLRSLAFSDNKSALYEAKAKWNIFTDKENIVKLKSIMRDTFPNLETEIKSTEDLRTYVDNCQSAVVWQIEECLKNNTKLLMAPPDTMFGDGTVDGLLIAGKDPKSCVVVPHPRVLPSFLEEAKNFSPISNEHMVYLAWRNLHRAWSEAESGHERQNSYVGGVSWEQVGLNLYSVKHVLPTVYLLDFTKDDLNYFKTAISFGSFDHTFPGEVLVPQGRQRYVGSSDAAFIVEITEADKNVPPIYPGPVDGFWRNHPHNEHNKQIRAIFRAAPTEEKIFIENDYPHRGI